MILASSEISTKAYEQPHSTTNVRANDETFLPSVQIGNNRKTTQDRTSRTAHSSLKLPIVLRF